MALDRETKKDTERLKQEIRRTQSRSFASNEVNERNVESLYGLGRKDKDKNDILKLVRGMGTIDKKDRIGNSVVVSSKGLSKKSGLITDDDDIIDDTFSVEQTRNDREREYHEKSMSNLRHTMQAQSKAMLTGMNSMHLSNMRMQNKNWKAQIAATQNMVNALTKANEFRYTVQANYYKNSIDYKKNILSELESIHRTLRVGFNINNKGEVVEDRVVNSMARVMLGEDWKKGMKGGLKKALEDMTGGAFGMMGLVKELMTSGLDQLNRGGLFKNLATMGVKAAGGKFLGKGRTDQIATLISDPGAFLEALADRMKHSNNSVFKSLGKGFGSNKENFGSYSGVDSHKNMNMKDRASFDKAAHTALTRIIPMHLSNIEAKLHNRDAVYFDYGKNKFMSAAESKKSLSDIKKKNVAEYEKNVNSRSKYLIETMREKDGVIKRTLDGLDEKTRNELILLLSGLFQALAYSGENISSVFFNVQVSPGMLEKYIPQLKIEKSDEPEIRKAKENRRFLILQILSAASNNFNEELADLIAYAKDLKDNIDKSIKEASNAIEGSTSTFAEMAGYYQGSGKSSNNKRIDIYNEKQAKDFEKYSISYEAERLRVQKVLAETNLNVKRDQIYELMQDVYENQTSSGKLIAAKGALNGINDILNQMKENGVDYGPKYDMFIKMKENAESALKKLRDKEKDITESDLDDWAEKGHKTNRFGGAKIPTNAKEIKENAELFLNSELGNKVSKTVQFGTVAALSALIAKKGGMGKYGAPIAGAVVASAVHASGKLNKMVRVIGTEEGDELMEDGRTRREALMHNLIKDMLPAGFAVATGVKVSNFIKNSINFGGILGPVIGFGVGSAVFAISKVGWVKKLAKGLFGGVGKILGFVDKKLFKGFFTDITGGVKNVFMEGIGKKLGLDKKSVSYKDILDKNGTKKPKAEKKEKVEEKETADEEVSGNASVKSLMGTNAGVCAPMIMSRVISKFQKRKVSDSAFEDDALEYMNKSKDGITMNFFYEKLADTGLFKLTRIQQASISNWESLFRRKNTVVIGHVKFTPNITFSNGRGSKLSMTKPTGLSRKDDGHFLLFTDASKNTVMQFDPLTKKTTKVDISSAWMKCDVILGVTFMGDKSKTIEFDVDDDGPSKTTVKGAVVGGTSIGKGVGSSLGNPLGRTGKWSSIGFDPNAILNVNIVGGHLDALGVIGGMDAQSYKTKVTDMIRKPISSTKVGAKQLNNSKEFYNRDKYGRGIKDEQNRQEERERANAEALQNIAGKDKDKKPEEEKKGIWSKILGMFPFLLGLFPFLKNMKSGIFGIVAKGMSFLGKGIWKGVKGVLGIGKKVGGFAKKGWDKITGLFGKGTKDGAEELLEETAEKASKETGEELMEEAVKVGGKEIGEEVIEETAESVAKEGIEKGAESASKGVLSKTLTKLGGHIDTLGTKAKSLPIIGKLVDSTLAKKFTGFFKGFLAKSAKEAVEEGVEASAKAGAKASIKGVASTAGPLTFGIGTAITIAFGVADVIMSVKNAHNIFNVKPNEVTSGMRVACGLVTGFLSALEVIPFASWVLLPVRILFEKKMIVAAYKFLFEKGEKEKAELEEAIKMDTNGDGEITEQERADYLERARKRKEIDKRNGNKYADMVLKRLSGMVNGIHRIPFIGKLLKDIGDKSIPTKTAQTIGKKIREGIVKQFTEQGTPMMKKQLMNKGVTNKIFGNIKRLFSPTAAGIEAIKSVQRTAEIMGADENTPVTIYMQIAVAMTYYFLGLLAASPDVGFIMGPLKEYAGDEIARVVYKEVLIPVEDAIQTGIESVTKLGLQLFDANGDGKIDDQDVKIIKNRMIKKAEDLAKKIKEMIQPLLDKGKDIVKSVKNNFLVKGAMDFIKKQYNIDIPKFADDCLQGIADFIEKIVKDMPPAVMQEMDKKPTWATKAMNVLDKGIHMLGVGTAIDIMTSITKALTQSHLVFDIESYEVDQCHQLTVLFVDLGLQHLISHSPLASNIGKVVRDAYLPKICIPLYNKWFGEVPGGVKLEDYGDDMKDPRVTQAKLEEQKAKKKKDEESKRREMSEDQKNMQKNEQERFKDMANSLFGEGGLAGGFIDSEGNPVALQAQANQGGGSSDSSSSSSSDSSTSSDSSSSSGGGSSGGYYGTISEFDKGLINKYYTSTPNDEEWKNWRRFIAVHPKQWTQAMGWLGGNDSERQQGIQKLMEWANFIRTEKSANSSVGKATAVKATKSKSSPVPTKTMPNATGSLRNKTNVATSGINIFKPKIGGRGSIFGGRGSNTGGRLPFYSQDTFLAKLNIGSENGSEAGCALAVAKMIIKFRGIKMNDMELYSTAKKYILPDNSIEPSFFNDLGGSSTTNVIDLKTSISQTGSAVALLVNKGGYNHFVAVINDNGKLLLGDPESDGYEEIGLDTEYLNVFYSASVFDDNSTTIPVDVFGGKGRGRIGGKGPGDNNSGPKRIGFGQGGEVGSNNRFSASLGGSERKNDRKASYSGSLYDYKPGQIRLGSGGSTGATSDPSVPGDEGSPYGKIVEYLGSPKAKTVKVKYEDGTITEREGDAAWRNNNPGNMKMTSWQKDYGAWDTQMKAPDGGTWPLYPSKAAGNKARGHLLFSKYGNSTVAQMISKYAPNNGFNNTSGYISAVESALGGSKSKLLKDMNEGEQSTIMSAMAKQEGNHPGKETVVQAGSGGKGRGRTSKPNSLLGGRGPKPTTNTSTGASSTAKKAADIAKETAAKALGNDTGFTTSSGKATKFSGQHKLPAQALARLEKYYDPRFVELMKEFSSVNTQPIMFDYNLGFQRTPAQQKAIFDKGHSRTLNSKHVLDSSNRSHAVDILYAPNGKLENATTWNYKDPKTEAAYRDIATNMKNLGNKYGFKIVWGETTLKGGDFAPAAGKTIENCFRDPNHFEYSDGTSNSLTSDASKGSTSNGAESNAQGTVASQDPGKLVLKGGAMGGWYDDEGNTIDLEGAVAKALDKKYGNGGSVGGSGATTSSGGVGGAPWMEIAKREIGVSQAGNPAKVLEYCKAGGSNAIVFWCAAFISWCLKQAGVDITGSVSSQFPTMSPGNTEFEKLSSPRYGAIAVLKRNKGRISNGTTAAVGHITFFVKDDGNGQFTGLGGNQGHREVKESHYTLTSGGGFTLVGFFWPKKMKNGAGTATSGSSNPKNNTGQAQGHYSAGAESELLEGFYKPGMSYPEAVAALDRKSGNDNKYLLADIDAQNMSSQFNSIYGTGKTPSASSSYNQSINMVNNSNLKASPLNMNNLSPGVGFTGNPNYNANRPGSIEGIMMQNNKLMQELIKENRLLRGLSEKQLDMQTWTALSNEEISKKKFSSDITNVYTGNDTDKASQFDELNSTLNRWKAEKIDINYDAEFTAEETARAAKSSNKSTTARVNKAKRSVKSNMRSARR